jgi:hypothetical protein
MRGVFLIVQDSQESSRGPHIDTRRLRIIAGSFGFEPDPSRSRFGLISRSEAAWRNSGTISKLHPILHGDDELTL